MKRFSLLLICMFVASTAMHAQVPLHMTYQGFLTTSSGVPLENGSYTLRFDLYNRSTGGVSLWNDVQTNIVVTRGAFSIILGSTVPFIIEGIDSAFIELSVLSGPGISSSYVFSPRTWLVSVPFALRARIADSLNQGAHGFLRTSGGIVTGPINSNGEPPITMGKGNFGLGNINSGENAFVAGMNNKALGDYSTISGGGGKDEGESNLGIGDYSTIGGGKGNAARFPAATVGGGENNTAEAEYTTIAGGITNSASSAYATIGGGYSNTAASTQATVAGGFLNRADGENTAVAGGGYNHAQGNQSFVGGGWSNRAGGNFSVVVGGQLCTSTGWLSVVGGGNSNNADGWYSVVSGGSSNISSGIGTVVSGGTNNYAAGAYAVVAGGGSGLIEDSNSAQGVRSAIGGGSRNLASAWNTVVDGGHANIASANGAVVGGGSFNRARADYAVVAGGGGNATDSNSALGVASAIGGGASNVTRGWASVIGGGLSNSADGHTAFIGGGGFNQASGDYAVVSGGGGHNITDSNSARGPRSVIGGGTNNLTSGWYSTIPGGESNIAGNNYAFAAGRRAKAWHEGSFVWGDATNADVASAGINTLSIRASGGIWLGKTSSPTIPAGRFINTSTGAYLTNGGIWTNASSRTLKTGFQQIQPRDILQRLAHLEISTWSYISEDPVVRHLGPTAEDFHAAFGLSNDNISISTADADGVALTSIKALYELIQERESQIDMLTQRIERLESALSSGSRR